MNFDNSQHSQNKTQASRALPIRQPGTGEAMWRTLDNQFIKVFDASVGTYYINKQINKIIVILGIVLIAYALIYHTYSSFYLNQSNSITNQQQSLIDNNIKRLVMIKYLI